MSVKVRVQAATETKSSSPDGRSLDVSPVFFSARENAVVAQVEVLGPDGKLLQRAILTLSGSTGALQLRHLTEPVEPKFARKNEASP